MDTRAAIHAALGDRIRLGIVDELTCSDRSPSELAARFRLSGNLLAHHLGVLESAGVVTRVTSAGDKRRRYVRLRPEAMDLIGLGTSHGSGPVVFVCTHNSARSQLAAALWQRHTGHAAASAGTEPAERVHPRAVEAAARTGLDISHAVPRLLAPEDLEHTLVVTVCDRAHEQLQPQGHWWHWSIPDPVETGTRRAFDETLAHLERRITTVSN